jgi:elongator complex protein 3
MTFLQLLTKEIKSKKIDNVEGVIKLRDNLAKIHKPKHLPSLIQVLLSSDNAIDFIKTKPTRTISGVAPIAIMTYPRDCDHGTCTFCPGGVNSYFGDVPKSYTGNEPASMRAIRNKFDAYLQVFNRLEQFSLLNQTPEKVELIIMGGTFPSYPKEYQDEFIKDALKAMNDFSLMFFKENKFNFKSFKEFFELPSNIYSKERIERIQTKLLKLKKSSTLGEEQLRNETTKIRCCVLNIETKPDVCNVNHINQLLRLGTTRVELGIQTLNNKILKLTNRGHTVEDSIKATQLLKDSLLKTCYHMMQGLPKSTKKEDINNFKEIFSNQDYQPDALKIYPCMVMPGTPLHEQYKKGLFTPIKTEQAAEIILEGKKFIPKYCRVMRIQRDIPTKVTIDGVNITNFRQYLHDLMGKKGIKCKCIRCREPKNKQIDFDNIKILREDYKASNGTEIFISMEDTKNDVLLGFTRLRIPYKPFRKEITSRSSGIRELHIYGQAIPLGKKGLVQHKGLGKKLLLEAEKIAKEEFDVNKMLIISGIGVKEYFSKLKYKRDGFYMSKSL